MSVIKCQRFLLFSLKKPRRVSGVNDEGTELDRHNRERLAVFIHLIRRLMAFNRVVVCILLRILRPLRKGWHVSNITVCLMGAALGLGAALIFLRGFIFTPGLAQYWDLQWWYSSRQYPMHYMWGEYIQAPEFINHVLRYPLIYLYSAEASERIVYLFIFTIMGLSMFFAVYKLTANRHPTPKIPVIAATTATLIFIVNSIVSTRMWNFLVLWYYAFMPLLLYFSYTAFRDIASFKRKDFAIRAIPVALILFLMSATPRMPLFFPIFGVALLSGISRPFLEYIKRASLFLVIVMVSYAALSAFWLVPLAMGSGTQPYWYIMARGDLDFTSQFLSMWRMFTLQPYQGASFFSDMYTATGALQAAWKVCVISTPFIALSALIFRRSKLVLWLALFTVVFAFMAKGNSPPFGGFYEWLVFDAPVVSSFGYQFRSPIMWALPLMFCYAMLIGFTVSYFLGWARDRINRMWIKRCLSAIPVAVVLVVTFIGGYPMLNGDLSGTMRSQQLPSDWVDFNRWMEEEGSDGKIVMCPRPPWWGSPKPTIPHYYSGMRPSHSPLLPSLMYYALEHITTMRFGELQTPWNAKYVVVYAGPFDREQDDLELIKQFGSIKVYKNLAQCTQIEACAKTVFVLSDLQNMISLTAFDSYDVVNSSVVFADQLLSNGRYLTDADVVVSNQNNLDLYLTQLDEKYVIAPFDAVDREYTGWVKATAEDIKLGEWHYYIRMLGLENWQYDYGRYLVRSQGVIPLHMPFSVSRSGEYDIMVRCIHSVESEVLKVALDGDSCDDIVTNAQINGFRWRKIGTFYLEKGEHVLTLNITDHFNAVNIFAILPRGEVERYEERVDELISDKRLVYLLEGELALNYSGAEASDKYGGDASNGLVLVLSGGSRAWRDVELAKGGRYKVGVRLSGSAEVVIDGKGYVVNSSDLGFGYIGPLQLEEGEHSIEVRPSGGGTCDIDVIWLYSLEGDDDTVEGIFVTEDVPARVVEYEKVNPTKYKVKVEAERPFMLSFAEAYDRLWVASVNGQEYASVPLNSVVNGFWIEDTGDLDVTIEFKVQRWFCYGAIVSSLGLVAMLVFLLWVRKKRRG